MIQFCDLHTHVLPGVDDGAPNLEYALKMLSNAVASDVRVLAATPHMGGLFDDDLFQEKTLKERFLALKEAAKDLPLRLISGAEVHVSCDLPRLLQEGKIPTLGDGRYLLTEFPFDTKESDFEPMLSAILSLGFIPLIAHPERYQAVCKNPRMVLPWLDMGCHLQLTGGSVLGEYGKIYQRTAAVLLQNDLVACIASDAHGISIRSNFLMDVYDHLCIHYSKQYAKCLLWETPLCICENEDL